MRPRFDNVFSAVRNGFGEPIDVFTLERYRPVLGGWCFAHIEAWCGRYFCIYNWFVDKTIYAKVSADCDKSPDPIRMMHRKVKPYDGTVAPTDDIQLIDFQVIKKLHHIVCHYCIAG